MADITFIDGEGKTITLDGSLRISDLVEMGVLGPNGWATLRVGKADDPPRVGVYVAPVPGCQRINCKVCGGG